MVAGRLAAGAGGANNGSPKCEDDHPQGRSSSHLGGLPGRVAEPGRDQPSSSPSTERRRLGAVPLSTGACVSLPELSASSCWVK
jgi:hypothetical protein